MRRIKNHVKAESVTQAAEVVMEHLVKILVIEKETWVSMMLTDIFCRKGFEVKVAWRSTQALWLADTEDFHLVMLNTHTPDLCGLQTYQSLRERPRFSRTPVIFMGNAAGDTEKQRALNLGAADFLAKPLSATDCIYRVVSVLKAQQSEVVT